jgi:hypothetical protein
VAAHATLTGPPPSHEVGLAGEHYVAMRLAMVGITPSVLPARTQDADVIAILGGRSRTLQVKTMGAAGRSVVDMAEARILRPDFLVIVALNMPGNYRAQPGTPIAYVLPRRAVRKVWELGGYPHPKRPGLRLSRVGVREFLARYEEAWDLVDLALRSRAT